MQSSSGLINIHELRWLGDWLWWSLLQHAGPQQQLAAFVHLAGRRFIRIQGNSSTDQFGDKMIRQQTTVAYIDAVLDWPTSLQRFY